MDQLKNSEQNNLDTLSRALTEMVNKVHTACPHSMPGSILYAYNHKAGHYLIFLFIVIYCFIALP